MRSFSHIVNVVGFPPTSELYCAQPITLETMRIAKEFATGTVRVNLLAAQFRKDRAVVPDYFEATPDLDRSVLDFGNFKIKRKLPLVKDILDRAYEARETDFVVFTNIDIGILPNFYVFLDQLIDRGFDSFVINRRTIPKTYTKVQDIPMMFAEAGRPHGGFDCFVFSRDAYRKFELGLTCVGTSYIGRVMALNQMVNSKNFKAFFNLHVTFHAGNEGIWRTGAMMDYRRHNQREYSKILSTQGPGTARRLRRLFAQQRRRALWYRLGEILELP